MDDYELARICEALGHPMRARIYRILLERGEVRASELFHELKEEFKIGSRQTIFNHINYLGISDLVETRKEKGEVVVKLKKKVKIEVEEIGK
jgi:DNA-binding transcriptional ArsR family regulator